MRNVHKHNLHYHINIYDETGSYVSYVLERVKGENERYNFKTTILNNFFYRHFYVLAVSFHPKWNELACY